MPSSATVASVPSVTCSVEQMEAEAEAEAEAEERRCASTAEVEEVEAMEERRCGRLGLACANCCARWLFIS